MSRRWKAECWLGSSSGYVDIEVTASTATGAKEQMVNIYGAERVVNLREISSGNNESFSSPTASAATVGLVGSFFLFVYFTPWILMILYGAAATWVSEKVTGQTVEEYIDIQEEESNDSSNVKALITFGAAILFGAVGFIHGNSLNKEFNMNDTQDKIEEVRN